MQLTLEFNAEGEKVATRTDVIVKIFDADAYKVGKEVSIRYRQSNPEELVVLDGMKN